jgi:upstream activation factor subunit UAF30
MPKAPSSPTKQLFAARKPNAGFTKPVQPDQALAAVVGSVPLPRPELTKKLWEYIRAHQLQDPARKTLINADAKLKAVFDGKAQVTCSR